MPAPRSRAGMRKPEPVASAAPTILVVRTPIIFLLGAGVGVGIYFLLTSGGAPDQPSGGVIGAFDRARGFYLNETNDDYRRARQELLSVEKEMRSSAGYHINMALIDLGELNYPAEGQYDVLPESPRYDALLGSAIRHLQRASALAPSDEAVAYNIARTLTKQAEGGADNADALYDKARELLAPLVKRDRPDPSALYIHAVLQSRMDEHEEAFRSFDRIRSLGKDNVPEKIFIISQYRRIAELRQMPVAARPEDPEKAAAAFREKYPEVPKATGGALERGQYTVWREPRTPGPVAADPRDMRWRRVTRYTDVPASGAVPFFLAPDIDKDCTRDLLMNAKDGLRILWNRRNATFEDRTERSGLPRDFVMKAAASGDLDNDQDIDLVLAGDEGVRIFLNETNPNVPKVWTFREATDLLGPTARTPVACVLLIDIDHDGDLDLFAGGPDGNRVYRARLEDKDGAYELKYREFAKVLKVDQPPASAVLLTDLEQDHDSDFCVTGPKGNVWFENLRALQFEKRPLPAGSGLAAGDVDNDLAEELLVGQKVYKLTDGKLVEVGAYPALHDLDGDGVIDRNPFSGFQPPGRILQSVGTDLNRDGAVDLLLLTDAGMDVYVSNPERPRAWLDVRTRGRRSNRAGIGTRIQLRAGDLRREVLSRDGLVSFGLGSRTRIASVLVRWTNGVEQGIVGPTVNSCMKVYEREGEIISCPFVYALDGRTGKWGFITDCQSGTPLGLPYTDGKYLPSRSAETVFIDGSKLAPKDGQLRVRIIEELWELLYLDQVKLRVLDHPREHRAVLDEGFWIARHPPFGVHSFSTLRPPRAAKDHKGRDILDKVRTRDRKHAVVFDPLAPQFEGIARPWSIELDFGDLSGAERTWLVMDGWVEFPTGSASIASSQCETINFRVPMLEVIGADGQWEVVTKDAGFPAGKNKSVLLDLTGKFKTKDGRVRLSGTQRLHWDAFFIGTAKGELRVTEASLRSADLGWFGVGEAIEDPAGEVPVIYDHDRRIKFHRWSQTPGLLTRYGDVMPLMGKVDDRYAILASGDGVDLVFDATALPPLPEGWVRHYALTTEGWVKDQGMNQAVRNSVTPLPFHAQKGYPDAEGREHPHPDFVKKWLTRPARNLVNPEVLEAGDR